ncbi:hypothetical protein MMSR116_24885 [Methylobacterium mesophilicum SR1.6/6]|uniref:Uncharacterized protein n=1 Tax=Methylobacterium mesophilicum SR1.6/6 TaxID=908290 RepID=A0A6B9FQD3_9HYPH|nr:hypothetical protein [Methylobacterium mesophilicum]QGY04780.1 hypothetical protein MMSR116_24885 [Methylobacterium mesophilicum SR1.6/6]
MKKPDGARLNALIEKAAAAREPSRELFADVWFATTGKPHADIKVRFALFMEAKAWTDAALIIAAHALPEWGVVTRTGPGPGEAKMQPPGVRSRRYQGLEPIRHPGGAALAVLQAILQAKVAGH